MISRISNKGQITLPAIARRKFGIVPNSQVEVIVAEKEIIIRPLKRVSELAGILSRYARQGHAEDWDAIRAQTEATVAEEVVSVSTHRVHRRR